MKKNLLLIPVVAILAACGTTDPLGQRDRNIAKAEFNDRENVVKAMPSWMTELPISDSARFSAADGSAPQMNAAINLARTNALRDLCMGSDGVVDSQTKNFETANTKTSQYESVTRTRCKAVDVTGFETYSPKGIGKNPIVIPTSTGYTAYILLALPTGKANVLRQTKEQNKLDAIAVQRAPEAYKELDKN